MPRLLELQHATLAFGGLYAVRDLDLHVSEGEIVSRSSGRTAQARRRSSTSSPASTRRRAGDIRFDGQSIAGLMPHKITRLGIARTFQSLRLFQT